MTEEQITEPESAFSKKQQELVDRFKEKMKKVADEVLSDLYTDVLNHATTDAHTNYHNYLRDEFRASFIKEITTEYSQYSWAHSIRMEILKQHRDVLQNKIIEDLEAKVKEWQDRCYQIESRRSY